MPLRFSQGFFLPKRPASASGLGAIFVGPGWGAMIRHLKKRGAAARVTVVWSAGAVAACCQKRGPTTAW